jgi:hypothetical protein
MLFKNIYIPIEIQNYILSKIKDTKGYKNARSVCKDWYQELKVLKIFDNQKMIKYITFSPKKILVYNSSNQIVEKTIFKSYGEYKHYKYKNNICIKTINNIPLKFVETINYSPVSPVKKIYNIENETLKTIHVPIPFAFPHPIQGNVCNIS